MAQEKVKLKEEQLSVINHNEGDLIVSASAGSGKTFVMLERLVRLVCEGKADVSEILAVTYTEAAATEMKNKLKAALIERAANSNDAFLVGQYNKIAYSDISTIDSFCSRIIRRYFFVTGSSPDYRVADDKLSLPLKNSAMNKTFKEFYEKKDPEFLKVVARHASHRSDTELKDLILGIYSFCSTEAEPEKALCASQKYYSEEGIKVLREKVLKNYRAELNRIYEKFIFARDRFSELGLKKSCEYCLNVLDLIDRLMGAEKFDKIKETAREFDLKAAFDAKLIGEAYEIKEQVKKSKTALLKFIDKYFEYEKKFEDFKANYRDYYEHTEVIISLVKSFSENYSIEKKEENLLDFADIERYALEILKNNPSRAEIKSKYKYIFIDEYQDVNGLQEEIINLLKKDNLFMVGDVKQSIYGFRGCRYEFFADKFEKMSAIPGQAINLNYNFRSAKNVIDMVNEIFSFSMRKELFGADYSKSSKLVPGGIYPEEAVGRAEIHAYPTKREVNTEFEKPRIYDVLKEVAEDEDEEISKTASLIAHIIEDELTKEYFDPKEKKFKSVTKKDITVLSRNVKNSYVSAIVKGLIKRNIDVVSGTAERIVDYPEIKIPFAFLKLLDCYRDSISLVTVMKSPIGGFSDEDLAEICFSYSDSDENKTRNWNFADAYFYAIKNLKGDLGGRLTRFDEYVKTMRFLSDFKSAYDVLIKLINDNSLEAFYSADKGGAVKAERLRAFVSASYSGDKYYTLKEFIEYVEQNGDDITANFTGGEDAVKVMTIHASKGLEFPVVIVCGLEKKERDRDLSKQIINDREYGLIVKKFDDENMTIGDTLLCELTKEKSERTIVKEELMLFYVALTRASYSLHLTYTGSKDDRLDEFAESPKYWHFIPKSLPVTVHTAEEFFLAEQKRQVRPVLFSEVDEKAKSVMESNFAFKYPYLSDTLLPLKTSVTAILAERHDEPLPIAQLFNDEISTDKERGIIAHKFLENYDIVKLPNVYGYAEKLIKQGIMDGKELERIDLSKIEKCIKSGAFDNAAGKNIYKEKSFIVNLPAKEVFGVDSESEVLIQGVIDLLMTDGDQAKIVDYKYSKKSAEALYKTYRDQLRIYALATEKILGIKVTEKVILNLVTGESVVID